MQQHPMDDFPVRRLDFDLSQLDENGFLWSASSPEFSMFINALGLDVPHFERYLVRAMNSVKPRITNPKLRRDLVALAGQEGHHARNFIAFNKLMAKHYPKVAKLDAASAAHFQKRAKSDTEKQLVGFTAGYETFTFLAGLVILRNYRQWLEDSNPVMKALWVWHQVEEVEHGNVAFDVYRALYGRCEWYRKWMVLAAGWHIGWETTKAYLHMARVEGYFKSPRRAWRAVRFLASTLAQMAWHVRPVFSRQYQPRLHPLATTKQSPIAIAWRKHARAGGNVLEIDRAAMAQILQIE